MSEEADPQQRQSTGPGQPSDQDTGSAVGRDELATQLSELARVLQQEEHSEATLERVVQAAVTLIPGAEEGSISVVTGRSHVESQAPSSDLSRRLDALQAETGQGPCLDAAFEQRTVRVSDMSTEHRWPDFAARANEAGVGSMLAFQLYVDGDTLGALNLYAKQPNAFDDESEHVGLLFAAHAAVAYAAVHHQDNLRQAMETRDLIGQAKGILMERYKLTGEQAFELLVQASQTTHSKLREVADELVHSGSLAGQQPPRRVRNRQAGPISNADLTETGTGLV
jgi:transcriptional regulator with GAF, ATPase, and Fis domain